jgi:hypothetical protein
MHNDGVTCVLLNLTNDKGQHVSQGWINYSNIRFVV